MSLSLLQGYSSAEDEEDKQQDLGSASSSLDGSDDSDSDSDRRKHRSGRAAAAPAQVDPSDFAPGSLLPSAFEAFAEVAGPPEFLNSHASGAGERKSEAGEVGRRGWRRERKERKDLPAGVVVEAKAQLVGIRDRVRSDVEGSASANVTSGTGKRVISAANPEAKDAAELLGMCLQCAVPKTYSHNRGVVCPICGDRPPPDPLKESEKKKGSMVKDKEKSKRMKGQSSHATWKSETEMHLRQQYD